MQNQFLIRLFQKKVIWNKGDMFLRRSNHGTSTSSSTIITTPNADPKMNQYKYWNREEHAKTSGKYNYLINISPESIKKEARIISLSDPNDDANIALKTSLPYGSKVLATGITVDDFDQILPSLNPNVAFVSPSCPKARVQLPLLLEKYPSIEWVHARSAGIDFLVSDELSSKPPRIMTNAKGQFSSSLAEYVMMACSFFAKDLTRLMKQKKAKVWGKYNVDELRGKTMGIVGE